MLDTTTVQSPGWWLLRLSKRLAGDLGYLTTLDNYYRGDHPLPDGPQAFKEAYRAFQEKARTNYTSLVVEAPLERMRVVGFRTGAEGSENGDADTWRLWQESHLDADALLVHRAMLSLSRAYVMVGPSRTNKSGVLITPEDAREVIVEHDRSDRRMVVAALKLFEDDYTERVNAYVYLPDYVYRFQAPAALSQRLTAGEASYNHDTVGQFELISRSPNPTRPFVPVVEFANRPSLVGPPRSEFEGVIDIQDRINSTILHRLVAERFAAFRQKAILNYEFDEDDEGNAVTPDLRPGADTVWFLEGENLKLFEFTQTDTKQLIEAVTTDIRDIAAITRTPPHYLLGGIVNAAGDALKAAETGLTAKTRERMAQAGESWESVMSLAHRVAGDRDKADAVGRETMWADPESRSLGELYDAATKAQAAGVPWRQRMELLGYSPQAIDRMEADRAAEVLLQTLQAEATAQNAAPRPAQRQEEPTNE